MTDDARLVAQAAAHAVLGARLGVSAVALEPLEGGLTNQVFLAARAEGDLIVRVGEGEDKLAAFEREARVTARVRQEGVPAPEVLHVCVQDGLAVMVARALSGEIGRDHPERLRTLRDLGALAARKINAIRTFGFGCDFSFEDQGAAGSWPDWLLGEFGAERRLGMLLRNELISGKQYEALEQSLEEVLRWSYDPVLNHGDLRLKNVLVNEAGAIVGVLDWEHSLSMPGPHWELSVALHDLWVDQAQAFLEGYGMDAAEAEAAAPVWRLFNALNYAPEAARAVEAGDERALEAIRLRFSGALDLFGKP